MKNIELKYKDTALVADEEISLAAAELEAYVTRLVEVAKDENYTFPESSTNLPFDLEARKKIQEMAEQKKTGNLKYVIVAGIGGSNLGALAVYEALYGKTDALLKNRYPKIIFADTVSPALLRDIKKILETEINSPDEILVNVISKSGTTMETIANFAMIYETLKERFGSVEERIVVTTGKGSKLWDVARDKNFSLLEIPKNIGGRYSVFSAAGLFPLVVAGVEIEELLDGARAMRETCLLNDMEKNPALVSAALLYIYFKKGIEINDNFFFNPELEFLGKWYRQLMGESVGKEFNEKGEKANVGITPIVSVGSADLHSVVQLYLGGPKDKFTSFVYAPEEKDHAAVPEKTEFSGLAEGIAGKTFNEIMSAIFGGVKEAYLKKRIPFMEVKIFEISPFSLGQYMQFKMIEMMYLAKLLGVNAFDQPNVEDYKTETKKLLS